MAKQDVTVELFYDSQWNTVTSEVYARNPIQIGRGRADRGSEPTPSTLALTFDNRDGTYNPRNPTSPLYGLVGRNTPIRVTLDDTDVRFVGEVSSWTPRRAIKGDAWTDIEAAGVLRRLGQGVDPLRSPMYRFLSKRDDVLAYWPLEDGDRSTSAGSAVPGGAPASAVGVTFGADRGDLVGAEQVAELPDGASLTGQVHLAPPDDEWACVFFIRFPEVPGSVTDFLTINSTGTARRWVFSIDVTAWHFNVFDADDSTLDNRTVLFGTGAEPPAWLAMQLHVVQDGSDIDWEVEWLIAGTDTAYTASVQTFTGTVGRPTGFRAAGGAETAGMALAHLMFRSTTEIGVSGNLDEEALIATGYTGETAGRRLERLCGEEGITFTSDGDLDDTQPMGPQQAATLAELFAECERTDDGILSEPRDALGLHYLPGRELYNQTAALTLDHDSEQVAPPLDPVVDDLDVFNDVTAARSGGSSARAVREAGPMNVQAPSDDPQGVGRYTTQVDVNPAGDGMLGDHAGWHLHLGTVDETRYPAVTVDLDANPDLAADAGAVDPGGVLQVANLEADTVSLLVHGYTETIGTHRRTITFNCGPASPYNVAELEHDDLSFIGSDGSTVFAEFAAGTDTTLVVQVATGYPRWDDGDAPFDIMAAGVRLTVTAVTALTMRRDSFTVTQNPVNGITKTIPAGATVDVYPPAYIGL